MVSGLYLNSKTRNTRKRALQVLTLSWKGTLQNKHQVLVRNNGWNKATNSTGLLYYRWHYRGWRCGKHTNILFGASNALDWKMKDCTEKMISYLTAPDWSITRRQTAHLYLLSQLLVDVHELKHYFFYVCRSVIGCCFSCEFRLSQSCLLLSDSGNMSDLRWKVHRISVTWSYYNHIFNYVTWAVFISCEIRNQQLPSNIVIALILEAYLLHICV